MTRTEMKKELEKLTDKQRAELRRQFFGQTITFITYDEKTDAIAFNVAINKSEFQWTAILTRGGKMIDLRCYRQINSGPFGYSATK